MAQDTTENAELTAGHVSHTHDAKAAGLPGQCDRPIKVTMMGAGRYLKAQNPEITLVGVQPAESFHGIEGLKHLPTAIVPSIYDESVPDVQIGVDTEDAYTFGRELALVEGLFPGTSTGAAVAGAVRVAREMIEQDETGVIVALAPDGGGKYLSTELWS